MNQESSLSRAREIILQDAIQRDLTTARRTIVLEILWHERYLTRAQLNARVEPKLGQGCFGISAWKDTFYRDMRVVRQALRAAGYALSYSRNKLQPGYYLAGQPALSAELRQVLGNSAAEADQRQIDISHQLSPAGRFHQGCSLSDIARKVVAYRIRQQNPELSADQANRLALQRAYLP